MNLLLNFLLGVALTSLTAVRSAAADSNTFESAASGLRITKPATWVFLSPAAVSQNLALPKLRAAQLERAIRSKPNIPFLVIARHVEPYEGLNPSVQVSLKTQGELHGQGAKMLLQTAIERLKQNFRDLALLEEVTEARVDGQPAARAAVKYTVTDARGAEFKTLARMWIVPRGEYMLTINCYGPQEGPDGSEREFQEILQSIKLAKL